MNYQLKLIERLESVNGKGFLQKYYKNNPDLITLKGSSSIESPESCIIEDDGLFWHSECETKPNFTINFHSTKKILLSSFSLLSCKQSSCVSELVVDGSNNGNDWNNICYVSKPIDYFKGNLSNAECPSLKPFSQFRFTHNSTNDSGKTCFPIHVLELYGFLVNKIVSTYINNEFKLDLINLLIVLI